MLSKKDKSILNNHFKNEVCLCSFKILNQELLNNGSIIKFSDYLEIK